MFIERIKLWFIYMLATKRYVKQSREEIITLLVFYKTGRGSNSNNLGAV